MQSLKILFEIVEDNNCPLYEVGESLILSDKALSCPKGKSTCLILVREMTQLLFQILGEGGLLQETGGDLYSCSGCNGLIKFKKVTEQSVNIQKTPPLSEAQKKLLNKILHYSPFREVGMKELGKIIDRFHYNLLAKGTVLINKGDANLNLYVVLSGELTVSDGPVVIATLSEGEICGEMSYLGKDVATATVRTNCQSEVLSICGDAFNLILDMYPEIQIFMARLLAERLTRANMARASDFESCMHGRVNDMVPAELFQIFHMNKKTGVLLLNLPSGAGKVSFREGCIINSHYRNKANDEAIFAILRENEGTYRFTLGLSPEEMKAGEIGDFMTLLMEGIKRVDEEHGGDEDFIDF